MTPASPLSRLEKLAIEYLEQFERNTIFQPRPLDLKYAFIAGGKALLQILSEPGEACGPRYWVREGKQGLCITTENWYPEEEAEYCDLRELTQARAAHEVEKASYEAQLVKMTELLAMRREERDAAKAALASSEARVRILSEALEKIVAGGGDHFGEAMRAKRIARQALLGVQR